MPRPTPFPAIVSTMIPFFISRQVIAGAGRVGIGRNGKIKGFQITQRADFFEGRGRAGDHFETSDHQHRDEPHADPEQYRRLHDRRRREPQRICHLSEDGESRLWCSA